MKFWLFVTILFLGFSSVVYGCQSAPKDEIQSKDPLWMYQDLRSLDSIDAPDPTLDLFAVYTRSIDTRFQIRLDFLDSTINTKQVIVIAFDTIPGGLTQLPLYDLRIDTEILWDIAVIYRPARNVQIIGSNGELVSGVELLIDRNFQNNHVVFSVNRKILPINTDFADLQIFIIQGESNFIVDKTHPISLGDPPPPKLQVGFVFWNSIDTDTPAGTLRTWDGAHSGPGRNRHGLKSLLEVAEATHTPLVFLDLNTLDEKAIFDYINADDWINELRNKGIITTIGEKKRYSAIDSLVFYRIENKYNNGIIDYAQLYYNDIHKPYLQVEDTATTSKIMNLLTYKILFVSKAIENNTGDLFLGGDFANTNLGNPVFTSELFSFIQSQPWIQVLTADDVVANSHVNNISSVEESVLLEFEKLLVLKEIDDFSYRFNNQVLNLAYYIFQELGYQPTPELKELANKYTFTIGYVITAAKWASNPDIRNACNVDPDQDGSSECILSNQNIIIFIEPEGGYIPFGFTRDQNGIHQIIGPTWEFMIGISDPSIWDLSKGLLSDPGQILGAFFNKKDITQNYQPIIQGNRVLLMTKEMAMRKSFELTDHGIKISSAQINTTNSIEQIPIVLDPWMMYTEDWGENYFLINHLDGVTWGIHDGISINLLSTIPITAYAFNDSLKYMDISENPNFDYPLGHHLPYPILLATVDQTSDYSLDIEIIP